MKTKKHTGNPPKSYRLKPWQKKILDEKKITFVQFVDQAFQKEIIPVK